MTKGMQYEAPHHTIFCILLSLLRSSWFHIFSATCSQTLPVSAIPLVIKYVSSHIVISPAVILTSKFSSSESSVEWNVSRYGLMGDNL
jgi:hypothetical protein